jgi:hypothetical protein
MRNAGIRGEASTLIDGKGTVTTGIIAKVHHLSMVEQ